VTQEPAEKKPESVITHLARLSRSDMAPDEFLKAFFALVRAALAAEGGGLWIYSNDTRQLAPKVAVWPESGPLKDVSDEVFTKIVYRTLEEKRPVLYYPDESSETQQLKSVSLMCVPVEVDEKATVAVLLARQAAPGGNVFTPDNVHILLSLGAHLLAYFMNMHLRFTAALSARLAKLAEIESDLAAAADPLKMAFIIANRSREMMFFDRVFVALPRGSSFRVQAISGIDDAQQQSAVVRALAEAVKEFARLGGDWHFTPAYLEKVEDAGLREKLTIYFETGDFKSILLTRVEDDKGLLAVVAYERRQESAYTPQDLQFLQTFAKMTAKPLRRANDYRSLPAIRAVEALQRLKVRALGPQRHRFILKIAAAAAVVAVLVFGRMDLTVRGDCRIQPYMTTNAAARMAGTVRQILKNERDAVRKDDVIALLDDREVENSIRQTTGEIDKKQDEINYYLATNNIARWNLEKKNLEILRLQLEGLYLQREFTRIISPQNGVIVTPRDRVNASLNAAVKRGEPICTIADLSRVYVEVEIKERDIGLVKPGQKIGFVLSDAPGRRFTAAVASISPASVQIYGRNVFIAQGILDNSDGTFLLGVTGSADVPAGRKPIVYVIFRSTINWIYSRFI